MPFSDIHPDYYNIPEEDIRGLKAVKFFQNENKTDENVEVNSENTTEISNENTENKEEDEVNLNEPLNYSTDNENSNSIEIANCSQSNFDGRDISNISFA